MADPHVQSLIQVCFNILKDDDTDPVFAHLAFEDLELTILALNQRFVNFYQTFYQKSLTSFLDWKAKMHLMGTCYITCLF